MTSGSVLRFWRFKFNRRLIKYTSCPSMNHVVSNRSPNLTFILPWSNTNVTLIELLGRDLDFGLFFRICSQIWRNDRHCLIQKVASISICIDALLSCLRSLFLLLNKRSNYRIVIWINWLCAGSWSIYLRSFRFGDRRVFVENWSTSRWIRIHKRAHCWCFLSAWINLFKRWRRT